MSNLATFTNQPRFLKSLTTIFGTKLVNIRFVKFNVSAAVMDKNRLSNFPLNSTRLQQASYFRDINYYVVKELIVARKVVDIAPCPPP